jgi:hypothetical protein
MRVANISSDLGVARIANADNHLEAQGAIVHFSVSASEKVLPAEAVSETRELRFSVTDVRSFTVTIPGYGSERGAQDSMGLVHLDVRILAPPATP